MTPMILMEHPEHTNTYIHTHMCAHTHTHTLPVSFYIMPCTAYKVCRSAGGDAVGVPKTHVKLEAASRAVVSEVGKVKCPDRHLRLSSDFHVIATARVHSGGRASTDMKRKITKFASERATTRCSLSISHIQNCEAK